MTLAVGRSSCQKMGRLSVFGDEALQSRKLKRIKKVNGNRFLIQHLCTGTADALCWHSPTPPPPNHIFFFSLTVALAVKQHYQELHRGMHDEMWHLGGWPLENIRGFMGRLEGAAVPGCQPRATRAGERGRVHIIPAPCRNVICGPHLANSWGNGWNNLTQAGLCIGLTALCQCWCICRILDFISPSHWRQKIWFWIDFTPKFD